MNRHFYPSAQGGRLTQLLNRALPLLKALELTPFHGVINQWILRLVRLYQLKLSPYKGFCCAHRKLYHGESCSAFFYAQVSATGVVQAIPIFIERLRACKRANRMLQARRRYAQLSPNLLMLANQEPLGAIAPNSINFDRSRSGQRKQRRRNHPCCDCGDGSLTGCDWFVPDCGDCDFGDIPCDVDCDCD